ncbi:hypothetical protein Tco_1402798 [Tanacetum coccineum]
MRYSLLRNPRRGQLHLARHCNANTPKARTVLRRSWTIGGQFRSRVNGHRIRQKRHDDSVRRNTTEKGPQQQPGTTRQVDRQSQGKDEVSDLPAEGDEGATSGGARKTSGKCNDCQPMVDVIILPTQLSRARDSAWAERVLKSMCERRLLFISLTVSGADISSRADYDQENEEVKASNFLSAMHGPAPDPLSQSRNGQDYNSTPKSIDELCTVPRDGVVIPSDDIISYKRRRQHFQDGVRT